MKIPFSSAHGEANNVGETNFEEHFPSINSNLGWDHLQPYVKQAARLFLIPYIGQNMYDKLCQSYADEETDEVVVNAIDHFQDCLAYYAVWHAMPKLNLVISELGIQEQSDTKGTSHQVSMWRFKNTRWDVMLNADKMLDLLLEIIEHQIKEENTYFDDYKNDENTQKFKTDFFQGTKSLDEYIRIKGSRRAFLDLLPFLRKVERTSIKYILCEDQYAALAENPAGEMNEKLLTLVRYACAWNALKLAIPSLRILIDGEGLQFVSTTDGMNVRKEAYDSAVADLQQTVVLNSRQALAELIDFLYENEEDFPLWANSSCKQSSEEVEYIPSFGGIDI